MYSMSTSSIFYYIVDDCRGEETIDIKRTNDRGKDNTGIQGTVKENIQNHR